MMVNDPSEAIESSRILSSLKRIFKIVESKECGGTILQPLLSGIAYNFLRKDAETERWLRLFFNVENLLLESKEIKSDFIVAVCQRKA